MLKKYSNIIALIAVIVPILSLISGLIVAAELESFLLFIYFFVPAVLFYIFAASYSALLEATAENRELIEQIASNVQKRGTDTTMVATAHTGKQTFMSHNEEQKETEVHTDKDAASPKKPEENIAGFTVDPANPNFIVCCKCGTSQRSNRVVCFECGAKFVK